MSLLSFFRLVESYLFGVKVKTYPSHIHGNLEIWMVNGKYVLNSPNANQSYDSLHHIFQYCFTEIGLDKQPVHHVLLLGMGVGSVPAILEEELMMNCKVTAIENDPIMLRLGKEYFQTQRFKHLKIVEQDAFQFVDHCHDRFELVIIDLFADDQVPELFTQPYFLEKLTGLMEEESMLLFNMIVRIPSQKKQFEQVLNFFQSQNGTLNTLIPDDTNKVIYWQKG